MGNRCFKAPDSACTMNGTLAPNCGGWGCMCESQVPSIYETRWDDAINVPINYSCTCQPKHSIQIAFSFIGAGGIYKVISFQLNSTHHSCRRGIISSFAVNSCYFKKVQSFKATQIHQFHLGFSLDCVSSVRICDAWYIISSYSEIIKCVYWFH